MRKFLLIIPIVLFLSYPVFGQDPILQTQEKLILEVQNLRDTNELLNQKIKALEESNGNFFKISKLVDEQNKLLKDANNALLEKDRNNINIIGTKDKKILELENIQKELEAKLNRSGKRGKIGTVIGFVAGILLGARVAN